MDDAGVGEGTGTGVDGFVRGDPGECEVGFDPGVFVRVLEHRETKVFFFADTDGAFTEEAPGPAYLHLLAGGTLDGQLAFVGGAAAFERGFSQFPGASFGDPGDFDKAEAAAAGVFNREVDLLVGTPTPGASRSKSLHSTRWPSIFELGDGVGEVRALEVLRVDVGFEFSCLRGVSEKHRERHGRD